tara:strand:- start:779 stop:928 length:150 start_codon:yes stop_codon:yes gene_type:complete
MRRRQTFGIKQVRHTNGKKKTRQGNSVNTKYGNKNSKKYYVKKYRGQGK